MKHLPLCLCIVVSVPAVAAADALVPSIAQPEVKATGTPKSKVKVPGKVVKIVRWFDGDSVENEAVFSMQVGKTSTNLRVDFMQRAATAKKFKSLRQVKDAVTQCDEGDMPAEFDGGTIGVSDVDGDGIGELMFAYRFGCVTDMSPIDRKLVVLEGKDKFILRGTTRVDLGNEKAGGEFTADPKVATQWPKGAYERAATVWQIDL
jgi:hypothetical protein